MPIAEPGVLVGAQVGGDVPEALLAAVGAAAADPELPHGQVQVVADDQHVGRFELVEPQGLADRPAAEVHERLGLEEQDPVELDLGLGEQPSNFRANAAPVPPRASRSTSSKPMLWRVPWYLLPGLPRPTTSFIVAKAAAPG